MCGRRVRARQETGVGEGGMTKLERAIGRLELAGVKGQRVPSGYQLKFHKLEQRAERLYLVDAMPLWRMLLGVLFPDPIVWEVAEVKAIVGLECPVIWEGRDDV